MMIIISPLILNIFGLILNSGRPLTGLALFPFVFVRTKQNSKDRVLINHEKIHLRQQIEMLIIPFYIVYLYELVIKGYWGIRFEKEAYSQEDNFEYLKNRPWFNWTNY